MVKVNTCQTGSQDRIQLKSQSMFLLIPGRSHSCYRHQQCRVQGLDADVKLASCLAHECRCVPAQLIARTSHRAAKPKSGLSSDVPADGLRVGIHSVHM